MSKIERAPRLALLLLRLALDADAYEAIGGDLEEEYQREVRRRGSLRARAWFWRQAWRSARARRSAAAPTGARALPTAGARRVFFEQRARDARFATRQLVRAPAFTAVAVLALALGIGLTTTTFSIVRGSLLRGLPFERAGELVHFERQNRGAGQLSLAVTPHDFVDWRAAQTSFVDLGAYTDVLVVIGGEEVAAESHLAILIDSTSFDLLGVAPARGRGFGPDDERPGAADVILVGDDYWRTRLGADPDVVGTSIRVDGVPTTIVGVMPPGFGFPVEEQLWMPLRLDFSRIPRGAGRLDVFGRLLPGKIIDDARAEFELISRNLQQAYPDTNEGIVAYLQTFQEEYLGDEFSTMMLTMLAGAALVLAIACANVANLLAARTGGRAREIAVRTAIGAGGGRLFGQLITETAMLSAVGGLAGLGVAWVGVAAFRAAWARGVPIGLPHGLSNGLFWWQFEIDLGVLGFVLGLTALTCAVAGVAPALGAARVQPGVGLRTAGGGRGGRTRRSSQVLVITQFALTAGLLVTAGLMVKSVYRTATVGEGLPVDEVFTARVQLLEAAGDLPENFSDVPSRLRFWEELEARLIADGRVTAVAAATSLPMTNAGSTVVRIQGQEDDEPLRPSAAIVSSGFFELFDVAPLEGRLFDVTDGSGAEPVAIVNESFARTAIDGAALGRRVSVGNEESAAAPAWLTVVGVVPDLWADGERHEPAIYLPLQQGGAGAGYRSIDRWSLRRLFVAVRTTVAPASLGGDLREVVASMDPYVPVASMLPMSDVVAGFTAQYQVYGAFYMVFGAVALAMATIGLYSVVAYSVSSRTAEIGVRMAVGADTGRILRLVLRQGAAQICLGVLGGAALAVWLPFQVMGLLFEVEPWDPLVLVEVIGVLAATGLVACWAPARRAARVDPVAAMRAD